jgi:hypothetical protein
MHWSSLWKIPVTPSGIEPATFRLVLQNLQKIHELLSSTFWLKIIWFLNIHYLNFCPHDSPKTLLLTDISQFWIPSETGQVALSWKVRNYFGLIYKAKISKRVKFILLRAVRARGVYRYICTLSLTLMPRPDRCTIGKETTYPLYRRLCGPRAGLDGCGKSRSQPVFDPRTVQPVASGCTDRAIPAHRSELYTVNGSGIKSRWGRGIPHLLRPALGPTQPPVQWVPGLSRG